MCTEIELKQTVKKHVRGDSGNPDRENKNNLE